MRVGPWFDPLRNIRSPLTWKIQLRIDTWRSPMRRSRRSLTEPSARATSTVTSCRGWSPSACGHHRSGSATVMIHSTWFSPAASWRLSMLNGVADRGADGRLGRLGDVEHRSEGHDCSGLVGLAAGDAQMTDADRAGPFDAGRPPDAARIPVGVSAIPVLEHAGDVPLRRPIGLRGAGRLDAEQVLGPGGEGLGHLELMREEVALGVADVAAIQPDVALVEDAVQHEPVAVVRRRPVVVEPGAIQQRSVRLGEGRGRPPVAGNLDRLPGGVVGVIEPGAAQLVVGDQRPPRPRQLHGAQTLPVGARRSFEASRAPDGKTRSDGKLPAMSLRAANLGQLKESGWESIPVKEEVRRNAIERIRAGEPLLDTCPRLRGHRPSATRERAPRRARRDLPRASVVRPRPA